MGLAGDVVAATMLPPPALERLRRALDEFGGKTSARGRAYAAERRVGEITVTSGAVRATVRGTEDYEVIWERAESDWFPSCSCPVEAYCKHAYAVAWSLLTAGETRPTSAVRATPAPVGSGALRRLREATHTWERQQAVWQLLAPLPRGGFDLYAAMSEILAEPDPDLRCWRLACEIVRRASGWLPDTLEPFRERPDIAAHAAERARHELARDLAAWAGQPRRTAERRLRLVFGLERRAGAAALTLQARLTTPRLADVPRTATQLQQLRNELRYDPALLPPEQAALLCWLTDYGAGTVDQHALRGERWLPSRWLLERLADSALAAWDDALPAELAVRAGVQPGAPVRFSAEPARLVPACVERDGRTWLELHFLWPDGESRRLDEVVYLRATEDSSALGSSLVLADGQFSAVAVEPPSRILERFQAAEGLPLPPAERAGVLGRLAPRFPHLREVLEAHTRLHPVDIAITLDLRDDDWLQLRLFAHAGGGGWRPGQAIPADAHVFEYTPGGVWSPVAQGGHDGAWDAIDLPPADARPALATEDPPHAPEEVWVDAPAPQVVEPVLAWLDDTRAAPGTRRKPGGQEPAFEDRAVGWWIRLGPRNAQALADAWERRPPGVAFFGTERVRRLLGGSRLFPRLRIEASGIDWFAVSAEWEAEGQALSEAELATLRKAATRFVRLPSGWVDRGAAAGHDAAARLLADLGLEVGEGPQRLTLWQLAGASPESLDALARLGLDPGTARAVRDLRARVARFTGLPQIAPPAALTATLRPYQQRGLDFLAWTASLGVGAILADDMGLGKTVQALAWLEHLRAAEPDGGPSLVVAPTSVVHNWAREAARFVPTLRVLVLERGPERHALRREIASYDLVVTNYALLRRDIEEWRKIPLRAAILDEAQQVKNPDAAVTHAAVALRARQRVALTGTPLENRALDLWSIMSFVNPGYLGSRAGFTRRFDRLDGAPHGHTLLAAKLRPVLLRRLKREVAPELPERIEERRDCELTAGQRRLYLAELQRSRRLVERLSEAPGGIRQHRIDILAALTRLRQICCHPALVGGKPALGSGKFGALAELLEPLLAEGHKVLVFSQFVECLKLLAAELGARDVPYHMLTGETVKREVVVKAFTDDARACAFLVSLRAGGLGLNLTAASYVVLFDPWWNPAVEAQAIDRTHRIGQDRTVIAYRLLTRGTIEEKIWELQQRKAALVRDVLGEGGFGRALTREDIDYLLAADGGEAD